MNALWTREAAIKATGGQASGPDWQVSGVSIDTRTIKSGDLFVALRDVRDGHNFVASALERGAGAALVSRRPEGVSDDAPLLFVDDVLDGLEKLAIYARNRTNARVIAITGSAGKTSTKDMLRHVLGTQDATHAAEASYNNHWGVPLTLARMPAETKYAVIEIGMNHPGEIAPLSRLAKPHIAIVTTVAPAHLEAFENIEGIAHEKASVFDGLMDCGIAIYNADLQITCILEEIAQEKSKAVMSFGESATATMVADEIVLNESTSVVKGHFNGSIREIGKTGGPLTLEPFVFKIGTPGRHFAMNALAVMAAALAVGADWDIAACDLATWKPPDGRGTRETLTLDPIEDASVELIDDAFNANPASMAASFEVLAAIPTRDGIGCIARGRRVAILGDMLELGRGEAELHAALATLPTIMEIDRVHCVGPRMRALYDALPKQRRGRWVATAEELAREAHQLVSAGDVVLVKGSKGSKVSIVVDALRKLGRARQSIRQKDTV